MADRPRHNRRLGQVPCGSRDDASPRSRRSDWSPACRRQRRGGGGVMLAIKGSRSVDDIRRLPRGEIFTVSATTLMPRASRRVASYASASQAGEPGGQITGASSKPCWRPTRRRQGPLAQGRGRASGSYVSARGTDQFANPIVMTELEIWARPTRPAPLLTDRQAFKVGESAAVNLHSRRSLDGLLTWEPTGFSSTSSCRSRKAQPGTCRSMARSSQLHPDRGEDGRRPFDKAALDIGSSATCGSHSSRPSLGGCEEVEVEVSTSTSSTGRSRPRSRWRWWIAPLAAVQRQLHRSGRISTTRPDCAFSTEATTPSATTATHRL